MRANNTTQYYVFGLILRDYPAFHIGVADHSLDKGKQEIDCMLVDDDAVQIPELRSRRTFNIEFDLFEIESFSSLDAANEAVTFWTSSFRLLGLNLFTSEALPMMLQYRRSESVGASHAG
jgi:hypothetical protein